MIAFCSCLPWNNMLRGIRISKNVQMALKVRVSSVVFYRAWSSIQRDVGPKQVQPLLDFCWLAFFFFFVQQNHK